VTRAPHANRLRRHRVALPAALLGLLALSAAPALASEDLVLTARGELQDPAMPAGHPAMPAGHPAMPAGHPAMPAGHPAMPAGHPGGPAPHAVPVSAMPTPPAPLPAAVNLAAAMPDAAAPEGDAAAEGPPASPYLYQARGLRDPFTLPAEVRAPTADQESVPPLERHAIADFRLVAVVQGGKGSFAMVTTTDGKGYTLRVGTRIGPDGGRVRQIAKDSVVVEVVRADEFGELKKSETILALRPEEVVP
jgi:type IV pilus assembly protein PilP